MTLDLKILHSFGRLIFGKKKEKKNERNLIFFLIILYFTICSFVQRWTYQQTPSNDTGFKDSAFFRSFKFW